MLNSIFGAMGQAALTGQGMYQTNQQGLANTPQWMHQASLAQALGAQNAYKPPRWMIDGKVFKTSKEFAAHLFPDSPEDQMLFILKYPE